MKQCLSRRARMAKSSDFSYVFKNPKRFSGKGLTVLYRNTPSSSLPRVGTIIAKKKVKKAVGRNRIKRCIRESFRLNQYRLPAYDILVIARQGVGELSNQDISNFLTKLWAKLSKSKTYS